MQNIVDFSIIFSAYEGSSSNKQFDLSTSLNLLIYRFHDAPLIHDATLVISNSTKSNNHEM